MTRHLEFHLAEPPKSFIGQSSIRPTVPKRLAGESACAEIQALGAMPRFIGEEKSPVRLKTPVRSGHEIRLNVLFTATSHQALTCGCTA